MNKARVIELSTFAEELANRYSRKDREGNYNNESFLVNGVIPTSEDTATIVMEKSSGKRAVFFCYYINKGASAGWKYFVPTDSHLIGMGICGFYKAEVEKYNYEKNL
jgi:hypothetical protein